MLTCLLAGLDWTGILLFLREGGGEGEREKGLWLWCCAFDWAGLVVNGTFCHQVSRRVVSGRNMDRYENCLDGWMNG